MESFPINMGSCSGFGERLLTNSESQGRFFPFPLSLMRQYRCWLRGDNVGKGRLPENDKEVQDGVSALE